MGDNVLILFKKSKKLKLFNNQLDDNNIIYKKESNLPFYNYTFKMQNINKIMYYILYNNLIIENEEFFIKLYFKHNKLSDNEKDEYMRMQFKRFGK